MELDTLKSFTAWGVRDVLLSVPVLNSSRIVAVIGELVAGGVPRHVRMNWEIESDGFPGSGDNLSNGGVVTAVGVRRVQLAA